MSFKSGLMFEQDENIDKSREKFVPLRTVGTAAERARRNINAKLSNPLAGFSHVDLRKQGRHFALSHEIGDEADIRAFELGAVLAQSPEKYANVAGLTGQEKEILRREFTHRWSQPWTMYAVIALCSLSAAVHGMGMHFPSPRKRKQYDPSSMLTGSITRRDGRQRCPDLVQTSIRNRRR